MLCISPLASLIEILLGSSSLSQKVFTHGPAPTTTCSQSIVPFDVSTPVTALLLLPLLNPVTSVPVIIFTPSASALSAIP